MPNTLYVPFICGRTFQPQTLIFHNRISFVPTMDILYQELLLLLLSNGFLKKLVSGSPYRLDNGIDSMPEKVN